MPSCSICLLFVVICLKTKKRQTYEKDYSIDYVFHADVGRKR